MSTGARVAQNVKALRARRGLSHRALSAILAGLDQPILASGIVKLEQGRRRVDVDELVALALALDTTPLRLLLVDQAVLDDEVVLTPAVTTPSATAWSWAAGESPYAHDRWAADVTGEVRSSEGLRRWRVDNRPDLAAREESRAERIQRLLELEEEGVVVIERREDSLNVTPSPGAIEAMRDAQAAQEQGEGQ